MAKRPEHLWFPLRVIAEIYGILGACALYALFQTPRWTCRVRITGEEHLRANPHAIWASWHEFTTCAFVAFPILCKEANPHLWMVHPAWRMLPIHRLLKLYGIGRVLGASGEKGRQGAERLAQGLKSGYSTWLNPDGPAGPQRHLKEGVLKLARETGLPILAISFKPAHSWTWPGWDRKQIPFPFTRLDVRISPPLPTDATIVARELSDDKQS